MTPVFLRCLVSIFFFFNGTLALIITAPSTVSVGQSVLVNWTRNDVDPVVFFLGLKETSGVPLTSTPVNSTGALVGCINIYIPMQLVAGTYIFLAYDIMGPLTVQTPPLTSSNAFTLLSPFTATSTMPITPSPSPSVALQFPPSATEANTGLIVGSIVGGGIAAALIILLTFTLVRCYRHRSNPNVYFDKEKMLRRRTPSFSTSPFPRFFDRSPEPPEPTPLTQEPERRRRRSGNSVARSESRLSGNGRKLSTSSTIQNIVDPPASQADSSNTTTTMTTDTTNERFSPPIIMTTPASPAQEEPTGLPSNSNSGSPPPSPKRFSPTPPQPPPLSARLNIPVFRRARSTPVRQYKPSSLNAEILLISREMMELEQEGENGPSDLFTQRRE